MQSSDNIHSANTYACIYMEVSWNRGTPKSSILMGCSLINQPFRGSPIDGNHSRLWRFGEAGRDSCASSEPFVSFQWIVRLDSGFRVWCWGTCLFFFLVGFHNQIQCKLFGFHSTSTPYGSAECLSAWRWPESLVRGSGGTRQTRPSRPACSWDGGLKTNWNTQILDDVHHIYRIYTLW